MNTESNNQAHDGFVEQAVVGLDLACEHHLANCPECQSGRDRLEGALRRFAGAAKDRAQREPEFWQEQASKIGAGIRKQEFGRMAVRVVPALAMVAVLAVVLLQRGTPHSPVAVEPATVSDHDLLVEVERAVEGGTPLALEPAGLLEDDSQPISHLQSTHKEQRSHEN
jgi:hypothetical protein